MGLKFAGIDIIDIICLVGDDNRFSSSFIVPVQVMPKQPGYEQRIDLYLLYHYLNHYNLFGSGYRSSCMSIIDNYLRAFKA